MKRFNAAIVLLLVWAVAALATACAGSPPATNAPEDPGTTPAASTTQSSGSQVALTDGEELFVNYCAKCHGLTGLGDGPSVGSLRVQAGLNLTILADRSDEEVFKIISEGKGTEMAPFELILSEAQRQELIKYIRTTLEPK